MNSASISVYSLDETIRVCSINTDNGTLTQLSSVPTGSTINTDPYVDVVSPDNNYLYLTCSSVNKIACFGIAADGSITPLSMAIAHIQ